MADEKKFTYDKFSYDDFSHNDYAESETVKGAKSALDAQSAQKPGAYQSQWQEQLNGVMDKIMNREKFSYDVNGDALYQQYKDKYIQQGKMAMADTMGQAAAMTGGYGNSYAATVGNQAYQASLQNLNDVIPELYQMAYDMHNQEGQDLLNQYSILGDRENTDYGRHRDTVSDFNTERDYLTNRYDSERSYDYSKYSDDRNFDYGVYSDDRTMAYGQYSDDKSYAYNEHRNAIADAQWQANFDEAKRQHDASLAEQKRQYNETMKYNKQQAKYQASQAAKVAKINASKPATMSTDDYSYWSDAFSGVASKADAEALRDQMVVAVGDSNMAYELYYQWERKNLTDSDRTNTTVYRGANGQTHMLN